MTRRIVAIFILSAFISAQVDPVAGQGLAQLPATVSRPALSLEFGPPLLKGVKVYADNPFKLDFILDVGNADYLPEKLKTESGRLVKYFLAALTVPEKDLWVNLSPYEKNRVIPDSLAVTDLGRDLLSQDFILKQITASLLNPDSPVGKEFWEKVYGYARQRYGTTDIPIETLNKVWIVLDKAVVYEGGRTKTEATAYVVESRLKVMLEQDYIGQRAAKPAVARAPSCPMDDIAARITREVVIPALEKEVNEGAHFAPLRQVVHSFILASWFKRKLKDSILGRSYADQNKIVGIDLADKTIKEKMYNRYIAAFKQGVYNTTKEDYDPLTEESVTRKYFSGGVALASAAIETVSSPAQIPQNGSTRRYREIPVRLNFDSASSSPTYSAEPRRLTIKEARDRLTAHMKAMRALYPGLQAAFAKGLKVLQEQGIQAFERDAYPQIRQAGDEIKIHVDAIRALPAVFGIVEPRIRQRMDAFLRETARDFKVDKVMIWWGRDFSYDFHYSFGFSEKELTSLVLHKNEIFGGLDRDAEERKRTQAKVAMRESGMFSGVMASPDFKQWQEKEDGYIQIYAGRSLPGVQTNGEITEAEKAAFAGRLNHLIGQGNAPWFGVRDLLKRNGYNDFCDFMTSLRHNGGVDAFPLGIYPFIYGHIPRLLELIHAADAQSPQAMESLKQYLKYNASENYVMDASDLFIGLLEQGSDFQTRNVTPLIAASVAAGRSRAVAKGLDFRVELTDEDMFVARCDVNWLKVVVDNLLQNAIKYTPRGG
ncbi:MAG: hypothetical protein HQL23_00575 [Candidatus Omnitrophica bacterium]|nr:hypothetical protein [Candidatus Omnitrophota bacterium]